MAVGDVIRVESHYQDSRVLSAGLTMTPLSFTYILVSIFRLLGVPFVRGFYSKDIVLESLQYSSVYNFTFSVIVYLNLLFTFTYSFRLIRFCVSVSALNPFLINSYRSPFHWSFLLLLGLVGISLGKTYLLFILNLPPLVVVPFFRILPFLFLSLFFLGFFAIYNSSL
jgi:NADH:ubiquinone oxidoreductase subunit 5 (subunit L)/multisubunit Na+/H+ antiporter MnhA subunit